jgi:glutamine synthetase
MSDSNFSKWESANSDGMVMVEYIWLGGSGLDLRGKTRVVQGPVKGIEDLPVWNYDGSSTGQATTNSSEIHLKPRRICKDPFRKGHHLLVMCDTYNLDGTPASGNFRYLADRIFADAAVTGEEPWFGIEQEYILYQVESVHMKWPIGWGKHGYNAPQGLYYCGLGSGNIYGRAVAEDHIRACLWAGLNIAGLNAEVFPGQWEFQVGICHGIDMCDQLWLARYVLQRIAEHYSMMADFRPKPVEGDWNGSGCHTNFSTVSTRDPKLGWDTFMRYCDNMKVHHLDCMKLYGSGNEKRMTGLHETARFDEFTYGVGARGCSVRIGNDAKKNGYGYMEDRRPSSNIDPYLSVGALADVAINSGPNMKEMVSALEVFQKNKVFNTME